MTASDPAGMPILHPALHRATYHRQAAGRHWSGQLARHGASHRFRGDDMLAIAEQIDVW